MFKHINQEELIKNYSNNYNITLAKLLYDNILYSNYKNTMVDLDKIIDSIINNILSNNDQGSYINDYFNIYWKYYCIGKNSDAESICDNIVNMLVNKKNPNKNKLFNQVLLKNLCLLIEDDIKLYRYKCIVYVDKIDEILKKIKINDLSVLKELFMNLISLFIVRIVYLLFRSKSL